ncbi:GNAT family N-acetyltransferase [uncultured Mycolicibacterium sp.]|uniref:GNAT family N-acetyltransferase n=1 Tax=uncultured Mycolicibacterium sp. TaxID=2320817 RepID=UPI00262F548D|nr:GNAT family N-acetyltransferase [uncultured Mycolicibacterium sp.]
MVDTISVRADELASLEFFSGCSPADLIPLAAKLRPLTAEPGQVLMRQGEQAVSFLLIASGLAQVQHTGPDGEQEVFEVRPGRIVGEIALLRNAPRTATVTVLEPLTGWVGDQDAFATMLELPGVMPRLVRTARQRLAAYITPIPVTMRDGSVLLVRPVLPGDKERATRGPAEFSAETLYRRFQSMGAPSRALLDYLFAVDYVDHFVWVVVDGEDGPVVGDARYVREPDDPATAEVAFIIADAYQGRGIGSFLMEALAVAAECGGVKRFTARVLADNLPMRCILDRYHVHWERDDLNVVTCTFDVPAAETLSLAPELRRRLHDTARQVIRAVG